MAIPFLKGIDVAGTVDLSNLTIDSAQGTDGQVLTSTGSGIAWEDASGGASLSGGAANKLAIWSGTDTLTNDTNLHWDTSNDRLGIGTPTPGSMLHLKSAGDVKLILEADSDNSGENDNPLIELKQDGGGIVSRFGNVGDAGQIFTNSRANSTGLGSVYQQDLILFTENSARVYIKGENGYQGRVGIGKALPSQTLDVNGNVAANRYYGNSNTTYYVDPNDTSQAAYLAGDIRITDAIATIKLDTTNIYPSSRIIVTKNGSESPSMGGISWASNPSFEGSIWNQRLTSSPYTESSIKLPTSSSYNFVINTLGSDRMVIDSSGNVGIGEPSPAERLHISGAVDNDDVAIRIDNDSDDNSSSTPPSAAVLFNTASNNGYIRVFGAPADTAGNHKMDIGATASSSYLTFSPSGSERMRIGSAGQIGIGGANYGTSGQVLTSNGSSSAPSWQTPSTGDITGVTAGSYMTGGGTSGTVTLNANASVNATANTLAARTSSGDIYARLLRATYQDQSTISGAIAFRVNNGSDNYTRYCNSPSAIRTFIGAAAAGDENIIDGALSIWNADGDGDVFTYNDSNPVHNGKTLGAVVNIKGDGAENGSLVRAGVYTGDHISVSRGYYVGTELNTTNANTQKVIDSVGNLIVGPDTVDIRSGTISVGGDANTYYPVVWYYSVQSQAFYNKIQIYRNYNETAPDSWNTSTHKGGLLLDLQANWGGWGGVPYDIKVNRFSELYSTMVAQISHFANSRGFAIWLRGGGATYHFYTEGPQVNPTVQLSAYDPGNNSTGVSSRTTLNTGNINNRFYFRGGTLYSQNSQVLTVANEGSGNGIDADTVDGIQGGSFLRSDADDTATGVITVNNNLYLGTYSGTTQARLFLTGTTANKQAILQCTNGNLHIDSEDGHSLYLNYYEGTTDNVIIGNGNGGASGTVLKSTGRINVGEHLIAANNVYSGGNEGFVFGSSISEGEYIKRNGNNIEFVAGGAIKFDITSTGQGRFGDDVVAYYNFSDKRLKTNIKPTTNNLDKVLKLNPVEYNWKEGYRKDKKEIGLIAQEVEKIIPEVVRENERLNDDTSYKQVDYEHLVSTLIGAVQEQQKQIDELKSIINGGS